MHGLYTAIEVGLNCDSNLVVQVPRMQVSDASSVFAVDIIEVGYYGTSSSASYYYRHKLHLGKVIRQKMC